MRRSEFNFVLPDELIAQFPLPERSASRLLYSTHQQLVDHQFIELPSLLRAGDLVVFNDTRVMKARLFGQKASGGKIEVLVERILDTHRGLVQIRASHAPQLGTSLHFADTVVATVLERQQNFFILEFNQELAHVLQQHGQLPLPPYITHNPNADDEQRYQTIFAQQPGAAAAPTAGLHFDSTLLTALGTAGIQTATLTLHVGAGTFQPLRADHLADHVMHTEHYEIPETLAQTVTRTRARGGRVVAVGTTVLRALESATHQNHLTVGQGQTCLFITPGYHFKMVDLLLTNFHLPQSTLLVLVAAFAGLERIRIAYAHAIAQRYRFFSYGDAMLLEPKPDLS